MAIYSLFVFLAAATVASPGPGVVMTLTNAARYGFSASFSGILGIAAGAIVVAAISATSIGVILAASAVAFSILKLAGASYLIYLGIKLWRSKPLVLDTHDNVQVMPGRRQFVAALSLQLTNPKPIFFFLSVFPQFIESGRSYALQFSVLVLTYAGLILLIHSAYALGAHRAKGWLASPTAGRLMNRTGSLAFVGFGVALATSKR